MDKVDKLTRQGVRDLGGGRQSRRAACSHIWLGEEVIGWRYDEWHWEAIPVYGQKCLFCGALRP